jgi:pSer/pThr/pTyr-binding forkhead associated (FHA) protein
VDEPLAVALKFGFLAVLFLFLLWVARSSMKDLSRTGAGAAAAEPVEPPRPRRRDPAIPDLRAGVQPRLEVVAAMGYEPGTTFDVGSGATLGRSNGADINVDDPFASSAHARIFGRGDYMYVEDMGSTNGTYLNGRQIRAAERLKVADTIRIGDTEYRYQE